MKILIVPDSFKGTLSSLQVCECIKKGLSDYNPDNEIITLPFADGGEGFGQCLNNICNGNVLYSSCSDIYGKRIKAPVYTYGNTAVIDCASASGLQKRKCVMEASSYGTGELIKFAYTNGFRNIILGLGGSGCCDGGAGVLAALGGIFRNIDGEIIEYPKGRDLINIFGVSFRNIVKDINFTYACDVTNEYCGRNGAAYIFARQKGASDSDIIELDNGLRQFGAFLPKDISRIKGSGAAGGICGGLYSVFGGEIKSGFDILAEASHLEEKIKTADIVITGEGKTDKQTLMGKLPYKIWKLCRKLDKKCIIVSGAVEDIKIGDKMISLVDDNISTDEAMNNAEKILVNKSKYILQ